MKPADRNPSRADTERLAIGAMAFIAEDETRLDRFLQLTGLTLAALRETAGEPAMLEAFLAHLLDDETLLLTFAANTGNDPALVARARRVLESGR